MINTISSITSLIGLIISIVTGTFFGDVKDGGNITLKKCNYYSLFSCMILCIVLFLVNQKFLRDLDDTLITTILIFYLSMYFILYIHFSLLKLYHSSKFSKNIRGIIVCLIVSLIIGVLFILFKMEIGNKYIPKNTVLKVYDTNYNYFFLKTEKDTPIELNPEPKIQLKKKEFTFRRDINKVTLKKGTKINLIQFSVFSIPDINYIDLFYNNDWIESNDNIIYLNNESTVSLVKNVEATLIADTDIVLYRNDVLYVLIFFAGICYLLSILVEKIINNLEQFSEKGRRRKINRKKGNKRK